MKVSVRLARESIERGLAEVAAGDVEYIGSFGHYYPKSLSNKDRQAACHCMCHEAGPAEHNGKCPCKIGGVHTLDWD